MPEQRVYSGAETLGALYESLPAGGDVLLVAGRDTYPACGLAPELEAASEGRKLLRFADFSPNPQLEEVVRLREFVRGHGLERFGAILAIGGGTAMDLAKLIKAFACGSVPGRDAIGQPPAEVWEIPLVAIPTTAGSGSEATRFAVLYVGGTKFSIDHPALRPEVCLLVPQVLESLPDQVAAASGLDALCQGIESYWSVHSTDESRHLASQAIALTWEHLIEYVNRRTPGACAAMSEAAHLAGRAINHTKTTAPHAVSYPITSNFGVAHGHAVALILAALFPFNAGVSESDTLDQRGVEYVRARLGELYRMLGVEDAHAARSAVLGRIGEIGLATTLVDLGINGEPEIATIVSQGFNPARVNNNPRRLTEPALTEILRQEVGGS